MTVRIPRYCFQIMDPEFLYYVQSLVELSNKEIIDVNILFQQQRGPSEPFAALI